MAVPEIEAMLAVANAFEALDKDAQRRVLRWAADKYEVELLAEPGNGDTQKHRRDGQTSSEAIGGPVDPENGIDGGGTRGERDERSSYDEFADLYDAASPSSNTDKALVAAYWTQKIKGAKEFGSFALNKELKDLGHRIPRINAAMSIGMEARPALILQVRKSGNSAQSRKTYKLSTEGIRAVERMLARDEQ